MFIESMIECFFCQPGVIFCFSILVGGNTSFVKEAGCQTFQTLIDFSCVAARCCSSLHKSMNISLCSRIDTLEKNHQ